MDRIIVNHPHELESTPEEYRNVLVHQLLAHTEGELSGGDNYVLGTPFAPNPFELQVLHQNAADELNHYMIGAKVLEDMGVDASYMFRQPLQERKHYPSDFMRVPEDWCERGLTSYLAEWAALEHIKEFLDPRYSYRPFSESCQTVFRDEARHVAHGKRIVMEFCRTDEGRARTQEVLNKKWGQVLDLFGRSDSKRSKVFLKWGLRFYSNEEARQRFSQMARPRLEMLGLVPPPDTSGRLFL